MPRSARRIKRLEKARRKSFFPLIRIVPLLIIIALVIICFAVFTKYWNGKDKVSVVEPTDGGAVRVVLYDPKLDEITTLVIPGETEVVSSQGLGTFPIKSIWQLGVNQKIHGKLLTETVTKNFSFPVFLWKKGTKTNIPFGDRVRISLFKMGVGTLGRTEIDLGKSQYLIKTKLADGSLGFRLNGNVSERLTAYFSDNYFVDKNLKVYIKDATGVVGVSDNFGRVLEVMGGKVVTIDRVEKEGSLDCIVEAKDAKVSAKIKNTFGCEVKKPANGNFDVEVSLGEKFSERF